MRVARTSRGRSTRAGVGHSETRPPGAALALNHPAQTFLKVVRCVSAKNKVPVGRAVSRARF
jgi:hypothetical protein